MKDAADMKTADLLGAVRGRGRPAVYASEAERVEAARAAARARQAKRRQQNDLVTLSVDLPRELVDALEGYMRFKDLTKHEVIAKLLKTQLLRKR